MNILTISENSKVEEVEELEEYNFNDVEASLELDRVREIEESIQVYF